MTDIEYKRKLAKKLEDGNDRSFDELNKKLAEYNAPPQVMDVSGMRLELLIEALKGRPEFEEMILDFEIACHKKIEVALDEHWTKLKKAIEDYEKQKRGLSVVRKPDTLLGPSGQPLPKSGQ